jgi:two-component system LytT family response regulator
VTAPIRTVIVDDERIARASIRVLLARDPDIEIFAECASGADAVRAIQAHEPELVFLDVQLRQMTGFDVLARIGGERRFTTVFVTAFDSYALAAFDAQALDYVLKPFDNKRFARALERAKDQVRRLRLEGLAAQIHAVLPAAASAPATDGTFDRIAVRDNDKVVVVLATDIDWIEANDYYVQLHVGAKTYLLRESLRDLENRLDPKRFVRTHRSAIVAFDRIVEVRPTPGGDYTVRLRDGTDLPLSRGRRDRLRALLRPR